MIDVLESRRMFAQVTLITHGYAPSDDAPGWIYDMATAVARRQGGADIYELTIRDDDDGSDLRVSSFRAKSVDKAGPRGNAVVILDWAEASNIVGDEYHSTDRIARLVSPYFLESLPGSASPRRQPLGELPIHLIGHSRGGSLVTELARSLGREGMWVDHVTTLDPVPIEDDPDADAWENITFFDNYYQQKEFSGIVNGDSVDGARNTNLDDVFSFSIAGGAHSDVWAYYGGTVNTNLSSFNGNDIEDDWYKDNETGPRNQLGFAWSRTVGRERPNSGERFEGAGRRSLNIRAEGSSRWDNALLTTQEVPTAVDQGTAVPVTFQIEDANDDATFTLFLDNDNNPYNGLGMPAGISTTGAVLNSDTWSPTLNTSVIAPGVYYVAAMVSNGVHTRYEYSVGTLTVLPAGSGGAGSLITFSSAIKATYTDAAGQTVTPKLAGPGSGVIVVPANGNPTLISLAGTTDRSSFTLSSKSATSVGSLNIGGSLSSLSASRLTVTSGASVTGNASKVSFGTLAGTSSFAGEVKSASFAGLSNADITFGSSVTTLKVNGPVVSTRMVISGNVGSLATKGVTSSSILLGFAPSTTGATAGRADVTNPTATLKSFSNSGIFSNSLLAAPVITSARIGTVDAAAPSTVVSLALTSLSGAGFRSRDLLTPGSSNPTPGLTVRIL